MDCLTNRHWLLPCQVFICRNHQDKSINCKMLCCYTMKKYQSMFFPSSQCLSVIQNILVVLKKTMKPTFFVNDLTTHTEQQKIMNKTKSSLLKKTTRGVHIFYILIPLHTVQNSLKLFRVKIRRQNCITLEFKDMPMVPVLPTSAHHNMLISNVAYIWSLHVPSANGCHCDCEWGGM